MRAVAFIALVACALATIRVAQNGEMIDGEYIVVFHKNSTADQIAAHKASVLLAGSKMLFEWDVVIKGYAVAHDEASMEKISEDPIVAYVEQNQIARALDIESESEGACESTARTSHWGLRRVSTDALNDQSPLRRDDSAGRGVDVYIIDTGLYLDHSDFRGRVSHGFDCTNEGSGDGNGHGTHCGSTAAGTTHGIASNANLIAVKVLNRQGSGTFACVISGINWVGGRSQNPRRVGSMSLGGGYSQAVNDAVDGAVAAGAAMISASGNSNRDACAFSPASSPDGVCVNSIAQGDGRSSFSNFGTCSHIFAPGTNILGAWIGSPTATRTISGTSMACPHVTGIVAEAWGMNPSYSAPAVQQHVIDQAAMNRVTNPGAGSPNRLANTACAQ
jgi:subtilisin family serine protease